MFILNISRIFLSSHDNMPVIVGTAITLLILGGATVLAAAPRMRTASLALITAAFVFAVLLGGWLSLGSSEPEEDAQRAIARRGSGERGTRVHRARASCGSIPSATDAADRHRADHAREHGRRAHVRVRGPGTRCSRPWRSAPRATPTAGRAFFGEAGDYVFYCTITGHREAGMEGVITVAGEPLTLEEAEAAAEAAGVEGGEPVEGDPQAPEGADPAGRRGRRPRVVRGRARSARRGRRPSWRAAGRRVRRRRRHPSECRRGTRSRCARRGTSAPSDGSRAFP